MRLIDAEVIEKFLDDFADSCGNHQKAVLREVKYALGQMPTIEAVPTDFHDKCQQIEIQKRLKLEEELKDAVEVVRCKDCKFYNPLDANRPYDCMYMDSIFGDDYCSRGEKLPEPMVYPQVEGITPTVVKMDEAVE